MPPPPLIAPTPSNVRPPDEPLMVIAVAACAGAGYATSTPASASSRLAAAAQPRDGRGVRAAGGSTGRPHVLSSVSFPSAEPPSAQRRQVNANKAIRQRRTSMSADSSPGFPSSQLADRPIAPGSCGPEGINVRPGRPRNTFSATGWRINLPIAKSRAGRHSGNWAACSPMAPWWTRALRTAGRPQPGLGCESVTTSRRPACPEAGPVTVRSLSSLFAISVVRMLEMPASRSTETHSGRARLPPRPSCSDVTANISWSTGSATTRIRLATKPAAHRTQTGNGDQPAMTASTRTTAPGVAGGTTVPSTRSPSTRR